MCVFSVKKQRPLRPPPDAMTEDIIVPASGLWKHEHRSPFSIVLCFSSKDNRVARALVTLIHRRVIKGYKGAGCWLFVCRPLENAAAQRIRNTIFSDTSWATAPLIMEQVAPTMGIRKEENIRFRSPGEKERERERDGSSEDHRGSIVQT